jgi:cell division protein FtsN
VRSSRARIASLLFGLGCLVVLAVTFALGVAAGRRWPNGLPLTGLGGARDATAAASAEREAARRPEGRGLDRDKTKTGIEPTAPMTFYRDLTAPLTSPPPPARPAAKSERAVDTRPAPKAQEAKKVGVPEAARPPEGPPLPAASVASRAPGETRFTVQVGAFKDRAQAEALRARLAAGGQDAYVSDGEVAGVPQYRVRVGAFPTREAARDASARLRSERNLDGFVTAR